MTVSLMGCVAPAGPTTPYSADPEPFNHDFTRHYTASSARTCEAARRALLSQGYVINTAQPNHVTGNKYFQPDGAHQVELAFTVDCAAQGQDGDGGSTVFASVLQNQSYLQRQLGQAMTINIPVFGSLSVPTPTGTVTLIKGPSETLADPALYQQFFDQTGKFLQGDEVPENLLPSGPASSAASAAAPASIPLATLLAAFTAALHAAPTANAAAAALAAASVPAAALPAASTAAPMAPASDTASTVAPASAPLAALPAASATVPMVPASDAASTATPAQVTWVVVPEVPASAAIPVEPAASAPAPVVQTPALNASPR